MTLDLVALVADKSIEQAIAGLLGRHESLRVRPIRHRILIHPQRDPGCYHTGHEILRPFASSATNALVVLDRSWEGAPSSDPTALASDIEQALAAAWGDRARCIVIDPEVEAWIWSDSPHVSEVLGWRGDLPGLRVWLEEQGYWDKHRDKPEDPKTAFRAAIRQARIPPSSAMFAELAGRVGLNRCSDPAFTRLLTCLREWFPPRQ